MGPPFFERQVPEGTSGRHGGLFAEEWAAATVVSVRRIAESIWISVRSSNTAVRSAKLCAWMWSRFLELAGDVLGGDVHLACRIGTPLAGGSVRRSGVESGTDGY